MSNQAPIRSLKNEHHPGTGTPLLLEAMPPKNEPEVIDAEYVALEQNPDLGQETRHGDGQDHAAEPADDFRLPEDGCQAPSDPDDCKADNKYLAWILLIDSRTCQADRYRYIREWAKGVAPLPELERLAELDRAVEWLKHAGVRTAAAVLKAALKEAGRRPNADSSSAFQVADPVPSTDPVSGADLASRLEAILRLYVVLPEPAYVAVVLWILLTFVFDRFAICPLLVFTSPTLRCGKTTIMALLSALVLRPFKTSNASRATLYRMASWRPTLLLDEFETYSRGDDVMRGIINSGHCKSQAFVLRSGLSGLTKFSTWFPKSIAMIGSPAPTIADRSVIVPMRSRAPSEKVEPLRFDRLSDFQPLVQQAARWALDHGEELARAEPLVPPEVQSDRARDNWRPLLAIAEALGGDWAARTRQAALELSAVVDDGLRGDVGLLLLHDMQTIFDTRKSDRVDTTTILSDLAAMDERPWPTFSGGRAMGAERLANLLKPFGIHSQKWSDGGAKRDFHRGYFRQDFAKAFASYLPQNPPNPPRPPRPVLLES